MFANTSLTLNGYGKIYDIQDHKGKLKISLLLTNEFNEPLKDDIMVECEIEKDHFSMMHSVLVNFANDQSIVLKFDAAYLGLRDCFFGLTAADPNFIIHLKATLLEIHEYYIEMDYQLPCNILNNKEVNSINFPSA